MRIFTEHGGIGASLRNAFDHERRLGGNSIALCVLPLHEPVKVGIGADGLEDYIHALDGVE